MMTLKTIGAFAVIIGCFAVVYPRFLHPLVLRAFGMNNVPVKEEDTHFPPHMRHNKPPLDRKPPPMPHDPKDIRQHMRPGPHPGMRAAAEMQKQQGGSGRGMMGIVLPMYAIGICVYLVYTLFKVFNKRGKYSDPYTTTSSATAASAAAASSTRRHHEMMMDDNEGQGGGLMDRMGFPQGMQGQEGEEEDAYARDAAPHHHRRGDSYRGGYEEEGEVQRFLRQKQQERELEDLLVKMDDTRNVSEDEMRALQKRLEETEAQMTRILQAMQTMQARTGQTTTTPAATTEATEDGKAAATTSAAADSNRNAEEGGVETVGGGGASPSASVSEESQKGAQSTGSSPDTESYEMVKNSRASPVNDESPVSDMSSPSSFERIVGKAEEGGEEGGECVEEMIPEERKKADEEESNVRHRKTKGHVGGGGGSGGEEED